MFVRDRMSAPVVTVTPDSPCQDGWQLMRDHGFRRLPVVDPEGKLVGIVSLRDLPCASPSPGTPLTNFEQQYLLRNLAIREVMAKAVITITPDLSLVDAARLMVENKIGGLPVVGEHGRVVGVITETDIFKAFVETSEEEPSQG